MTAGNYMPGLKNECNLTYHGTFCWVVELS